MNSRATAAPDDSDLPLPETARMRRRVCGWVAIAFGGVLLISGALTTNLTIQVLFLCLGREHYQTADFVALSLSHDLEPTLLGRIEQTGEEILLTQIPSDCFRFSSPGAMVGTLLDSNEVEGRRYSVWYDARDTGWSGDSRVIMQAQWATLPDAGVVAKIATVNLGLILVGALVVRWGVRRAWCPAAASASSSE